MILAGPGSGKTKTLTVKLARVLAEDVREPQRIACITYSNQCARELKNRLSDLGIREQSRVFVGTLHSFCLQHVVLPYIHLTDLPKRLPITVASTDECETFQQKAVDQIVGRNERWGPRFDKYRRTHLDRKAATWKDDDEEAAAVVERYEQHLDSAGLIDFDGMVLIGLHLIEEYEWVRTCLKARFPVLVVDEYQDLGHALHQIVQTLCFKAGIRLIAVGDPDQSIYGFTGAEPSLLQSLGTHPDVEEVKLKLNYRCGAQIIRASEIALGEPREFEAANEEAGVVFFHERRAGLADQASFICSHIILEALKRRTGRQLGDIAILYLDKNDGDVIGQAVTQAGWKYIRVDGNNPYQPSPITYWLEDCAAWCSGAWKTGEVALSGLAYRWRTFNEALTSIKDQRRSERTLVAFLQNHRHAEESLHTWLTAFLAEGLRETLDREPRLRDDKRKVFRLLEACAPNGQLSAFTVAFFGGQGGSPDHIRLTTLHSAKGLEYDVVVLMGLEEGRIPSYNDGPSGVREKRRLFYVGLTRARHEVHLLYSGWYQNRYGRPFRNGRSRFLNELEVEVKRPLA